MLSRSVRKFLEKPRIARFATIGRDGYPHIVPIYFMRDDDEIIMGSDRDESKVKNAIAHPKGAILIGGDLATDKAGYMFRGDLSIKKDPDHAVTRKLLRRYEKEQEAEQHAAEWADSNLVLIRLKPKSVVRVL